MNDIFKTPRTTPVRHACPSFLNWDNQLDVYQLDWLDIFRAFELEKITLLRMATGRFFFMITVSDALKQANYGEVRIGGKHWLDWW
jgi:hypothetical protein